MKPTPENIAALKAMGFKLQKMFKTDTENDEYGWWERFDGWEFRIDAQRSIKTLVKRMIKYAYHKGRLNVLDSLPLSEKKIESESVKSENVLDGD